MIATQKCFGSPYYVTIPGSILDDQVHMFPGGRQHDVSVADVTTTISRRKILVGKHYNGEWSRKTQLAARLQVSRNTIQQVYRKLESEGLLTHIPHHDVFIASSGKERIHELYTFRHVARCRTLRSLSTSQAKPLSEETPSICGSWSSLDLPERNNAFRLATVRASEPPDLLATVEPIQAQLRPYLLSYPQSIELHVRRANHHISIAKVLIKDTPNHAADFLSTYLNESFGAVTAVFPLASRS